MKTMKQIIYIACALLFSLAAFAADSRLTFEPLFGTETVLVRYPEPARYVTRAMYGARVLYGVTLLSGELEYTEAFSNKSYPGSDQKVEDRSQRLSVGLRTTIPMSQYIGIFFRAGGRATQGESKVTIADVSETHKDPLHVDPYAGAGLQLAFHSNFALNAGATMIQNAEGKYDSQYTLGLTVRFGKL
jgi:hypothetical protein